MKLKMAGAAVAAAFVVSAALAQGGSGPGAMGMGPDDSPGWALMTAQERDEHRARMMAFTNFEDCTAYLAEHHRLMLDRARAQGTTLPAQPRMGFCQRLPHKATAQP